MLRQFHKEKSGSLRHAPSFKFNPRLRARSARGGTKWAGVSAHPHGGMPLGRGTCAPTAAGSTCIEPRDGLNSLRRAQPNKARRKRCTSALDPPGACPFTLIHSLPSAGNCRKKTKSFGAKSFLAVECFRFSVFVQGVACARGVFVQSLFVF